MDKDLKVKVANDLSDQLAGLFLGYILLAIICIPCWLLI